ncbi:hypothetical protein PPO43_14510 [Saprospira sp. CCB-QB6]|uniref:WD40 repeat domain-containing protein n=1 Tax=Saprospira sp. CCB-QB6 TaxID=3023936 RepID=UPI00234A2935|nr:hypothetical protein [Saprospira sp. CCB-QB6]WCL81184.1 hypothetical protein PPO43_14510 [Saprospira sp. CCB-QB6]
MPVELIRKKQLLGHKGAIYALLLAPDKQSFFSAAGDGYLVNWPLSPLGDGHVLAQLEGPIFSMALLNASEIVLGDQNGDIHLINYPKKQLVQQKRAHEKGVFALLPWSNGNFLSAGGDGQLSLWSKQSFRPQTSWKLSHQSLRAISPNQSELVVGGSQGHLFFLDAQTLELKQQIPQAHQASIFCLAQTPNYLLSGGRDAFFRVWTQKTKEELPTQAAHLFTVNDLAISPNGRYLASASRDKTLKLWSLPDFKLLKVIDAPRGGHINSVNALLWANDQLLLSASDDRSIIAWELLELP